MSILTLLTKEPPKIGEYSFDAVLEDEIDLTSTITTYPVETGAEISDHRIINPAKYRLTIVMTNSPLAQEIPDFSSSISGGLLSNLTKNPVVAAVSGLSAGFLASSDSTRASSAFDKLIELMESEQPFDIDTGDRFLKDMMVVRITRKRDPSNENAMVASVELQEYISIDRLTKDGQPSHKVLRSGSPEQSSCSMFVSKGVTTVKNAGEKARKFVGGFFG